MYRWAADLTSGHPSTLDCTYVETLYPSGVALLVWVLSLTWFQKIHKGFVKTVLKQNYGKAGSNEKTE